MLLERGDLIGLVAAIALGGFALHLKTRAERGGGKSASPSKDVYHTVMARVSDMDKRLVRVEANVERMPTREEFHDMDRAITKLDGRIAMVAQTTNQTCHAVGRIEDYMLKAAGKPK